ncbi:MAG: hypothetical protein H0X29_01455 [Parachlamydiaceae bacterium]|nr:hypothetical protein [Parachlamydiaceae bacterium]
MAHRNRNRIIVAAPTALYNGLGTQAQKWGTSFVWDKGAETVSCITQKNNTSNKLFKELNEKTSLIWNRVDNEIRNDLINQGFSFNISTIDPSQNMLVAQGWLQQAVNSHQLYMKCYSERAICNQKLPDALNSTVVAQKESLKSKDDAKKQIDPLLVMQGRCEELESIKAQNALLVVIKEGCIAQSKDLERANEKLDEATGIASKYEDLNEKCIAQSTDLKTMTSEMEKYKKEAGDYKTSLEAMTKQMEKYRKAYKAKLWIDNDKEL